MATTRSETIEEACLKIDSSGQTDVNWSSDPRLRQVNVVVCTTSGTLVGTAHLMRQHRLLDDLNNGFVANLHRLGKDFMPLTEVKILFSSGEKDIAISTHVRKSNILFVVERGVDQPGRSGLKEAKAHLLKVRRPLGAKVYMSVYSLEGKMHAGLWQEPAQVLDGHDSFLPMTDVVISPPLLTGESRFNFVAINKNQIVHIGEQSEALQKLLQDMQKVTQDRAEGGSGSDSASSSSVIEHAL